MSRVNLQKGKVGASILGGYEKTSALVGSYGAIAGTSGKLEIGKPVQFRNIVEAESYGVKQGTLLHHHISEYFRMSLIGGKGASLWVLNTQSHTSFVNMIQDNAIKQMIVTSDGNIFQVGFDYIPKSTNYVDGLNDETFAAMKAAQAFADWCHQTNRKLHCVVSGADYKGAAASSLNLRDIKESGASVPLPQVSLVIAQDYDFAETLTGKEQKYAAVGTLLGCMAAQPVSYNIGEVETMSLTDATRSLWLNAGLSSHEQVRDKEAELSTLNAKGYIVGEYYSGQVVFNDDHVCTPVVVDADGNMNEHTIALSRTNAKVFREIYKAYLPKIKSTVPVDAKTGKLGIGMVKYFEGIGNDVFGLMQNKQEISGGETEVDRESNLLYGNKALGVFYNWVPMGTIGQINGTVNIKSSL
ncbi:DUF2586 family protein [Dysgonomonas sp. 520]|uniref:DUF2586 family protein n=1 Tax=Dysgonomonas sp. 520 TaxID=2302931 RepID=UPI0013D72394|nr:DUF2586 family protein [Dysgonomonas sp. 520]NDW10947.1 hypothetical protein [Dysgonomonas sp. 520]